MELGEGECVWVRCIKGSVQHYVLVCLNFYSAQKLFEPQILNSELGTQVCRGVQISESDRN